MERTRTPKMSRNRLSPFHIVFVCMCVRVYVCVVRAGPDVNPCG